MSVVENCANLPFKANKNRVWHRGQPASSSAFSNDHELRRTAVGVCVLADGDIKFTDKRGETETLTFGTGGLALGVFHVFSFAQIWDTGTTVAEANVLIAEVDY